MSVLTATEIEADRNAREARAALVADRFKRFPLNDVAIARIENMTRKFIQFAEQLSQSLPEGRSTSLAFTALQEAKFWANDAIAHDVDSAVSA